MSSFADKMVAGLYVHKYCTSPRSILQTILLCYETGRKEYRNLLDRLQMLVFPGSLKKFFVQTTRSNEERERNTGGKDVTARE